MEVVGEANDPVLPPLFVDVGYLLGHGRPGAEQ